MGTLKDAFNTAISSESWCASGAQIITDAPDVLQDWYNNTSGAPGFLQVCNVANSAKAKALFLQSVLELVATMSAGEEKTRLDAIGQETATLADEIAWADANPVPVNECKNFLRKAAVFLDGGNYKTAWEAFRGLVRAKGEIDSVGTIETDAALLTLWQSRCTLTDWANGKT